ncbi:MAG: spore coat U domain-containing protein [Pseudomonadota bacterium]|nr:spore coat U domain-containing protein [Pseudomonadota bacterium]
MKKLHLLLCPFAAAALLGAGSPAHANGNNCVFQARGLSMSFGGLNPASGSDVSVAVAAASLNADKAGDCAPGQRMSIDGDNGLHYNGTRRLKNTAGTDFIAYSLVGLPTSSTGSANGPGNNSYITFTFNGMIFGSAYANAPAGSYADTVLISVTP